MQEGFTPDDFDAYLPEKWASNMYTLPRRKVKDKLESLGRELSAELERNELPLAMHLSDDHPSLWNNKKVSRQWLFFSRDEAARKKLIEVIDTERTLADTLADPTPLFRHAFLGVSVDEDYLEVGLRLHHDAWVDRRNLRELMEDEEGRRHFVDLCDSLPDHYEAGLVEVDLVPMRELDDERMRSISETFEQRRGWLFFGARLPRDQVVVLGPEVCETLVEAFGLLVPLYRFVAWSPHNDAITMDNLVARRQEAIRSAREQFAGERKQREERRAREESDRLRLRAELEERTRAEEDWRRRERAARRAAAREAARREEEAARDAEKSEATRSGSERYEKREDVRRESAPRRGSQDRRGERPRVSAERMAEIRVGDRVEVRSGFLAGRRGVVRDLDDKDGALVLFGSMSSRLDREELEGMGPDKDRGRGRPRS
jgi:flagellar biosynthesis GTPase FlhF